jgi:hypothetical protein
MESVYGPVVQHATRLLCPELLLGIPGYSRSSSQLESCNTGMPLHSVFRHAWGEIISWVRQLRH